MPDDVDGVVITCEILHDIVDDVVDAVDDDVVVNVFVSSRRMSTV